MFKIIVNLIKSLLNKHFLFKVSLNVIVLLTINLVSAQEANNYCSSATVLCPNTLISSNNIDANSATCPGCEDDFNFCFSIENSIWFQFTTNATGGDAQIDFSNLNFEANPGQGMGLQATIILPLAPCSAGSYTQIGNCVSNSTANFSLNAIGLLPNTTYYFVVDGDNAGAGVTSAAEATFDISISGTGVLRPTPIITITDSGSTICLNDQVIFVASTQDCQLSSDYSWLINGELVAVTTDSIFTTTALNDGDILTVETDCYTLCPERVSASSNVFSVYSFPIDAGADLTTDIGIPTTVNGITTAPIHTWSPSFLFSNPASLNTIVTTNETVTITLSATENGCTLTDYFVLTVNDILDFPNAFSPNGDNRNEKWLIAGIDNYPNCEVSIYTRWGQEIYKSRGYSEKKAWDGMINSRKAASGVYYYIVDINDGESEPFKGTITLFR